MSLLPRGLQLNLRPETSIVSPVAMGDAIPKLIHQIWLGDRDRASPLAHDERSPGVWPEDIRANAAKLQRMNADWRYCFHNERSIIDFIQREYGPEVLRRYLRINPAYGAARADLSRYLLIYKYGGLYLDMKSSASRPLDDVIAGSDRCLLSHWNQDGPFKNWGNHTELNRLGYREFQQWNICSVPGHPFFKSIIETVLRNIDVYTPALHGNGAFATLRVTGSVTYTIAIRNVIESSPYRLVDSENDLGFVYSIYAGAHVRRHAYLVPSHYTNLESPLVDVSRAQRMAFIPYKLSKRWWKAVKARLRNARNR